MYHISQWPAPGHLPKRHENKDPNTCTLIFFAVLFIIVKSWEYSKYLSIGEWMDTIWCINTTKYYLTMKSNKPVIDAVTWTNVENIALSERSKPQKLHMVWFQLDKMSRKGKFVERESRLVVFWGRGWERGLTINGSMDHNEMIQTF